MSEPDSYPVFKGLGRKPTFMGVPTTLLLASVAVVAMIAMTVGLAWWGLLLVVIPTIKIVTRDDDKAFDVLLLEFKTRALNLGKRFWAGSSYAPTGYDTRRPWVRLLERKNDDISRNAGRR